MTSVLHWWPMGVRKSQAAPMATAIRKGSGCSPSLAARLTPIGAMISTVAALLRKGVRAIAVTSTSDIAPDGGKPARYQIGSAGAVNGIAYRDQATQQHKDGHVQRVIGLFQRQHPERHGENRSTEESCRDGNHLQGRQRHGQAEQEQWQVFLPASSKPGRAVNQRQAAEGLQGFQHPVDATLQHEDVARLEADVAKVSRNFFTVRADGDQAQAVAHAQIDFGRRTSDQRRTGHDHGLDDAYSARGLSALRFDAAAAEIELGIFNHSPQRVGIAPEDENVAGKQAPVRTRDMAFVLADDRDHLDLALTARLQIRNGLPEHWRIV